MDQDAKKFFEELTGQVLEERQSKAAKKTTKKQTETTSKRGESRSSKDEREEVLEGQLTIDVYQTKDSIVIVSPVAGVATDDLDISITAESVTIQGHRGQITEVSEEDYIYQECYWGRFSRSVILPEEVDPENAQASVKGGILRIVMPKVSSLKGNKKLRVSEE
jgi:HSP20 family protein